MDAPAFPANEKQRVSALVRAELLDQPAEERFDRITAVAKAVFDVETALISLVDEDRQWFLSRQGLNASETPRDISFCGHAINDGSVFEVRDAAKDPRFHDNPLVTGPPNIRFYAGQPIKDPTGFRIGTLCLLDPGPKALSSAEKHILRGLALTVEEVIHSRIQERISDRRANLIEATLGAMHDGLLRIVDNREIRLANDSAAKILGTSIEDLEGLDLADFIQIDLASEESKILDTSAIRSDGVAIPIEVSISSTLGNDHERIVIFRDLTEQQALANMQRQFISTVSHELRTPLTSIRGALDLLNQRFATGLAGKGIDLLKMASRNTDRLASLINDLLDLEKLESDELSLSLSRIELHSLVMRAEEEIHATALKAGIGIEVSAPSGELFVTADPDRLLQVIGNLLSNAIKHSRPGQKVSISISEARGMAEVRVKDKGEGIPDTFRDRVFERFAQADKSDTRVIGGTGLGLSISKAIIERLGGEIGFESEHGSGAEFYVLLPIFCPDGEGADVLVIEDNPDIAGLFRDTLADEGLTTHIAPTAAIAEELIDEHTYRLILLDLVLPDADGLQFLDRTSSHATAGATPVIVVSATAHEKREGLAEATPRVIDWVPKPVERERLLRAVTRAGTLADSARVLHVEDDVDVQQIVKMTLSNDYEYHAAKSLAEARVLLGSQSFDLLIVDVGLPDGSGLTLIEEQPASLPVIIYSGETQTPQLSRRISAALTKSDTSAQELVAIVRSTIREKRTHA